jgi:hypothetical protein
LAKLDPRTVNSIDPDPVIISPSDDQEVTPLRRLLIPSAALNEFRVAVDIWFCQMDEKTRIEAIQLCEDWRPPNPTKKRLPRVPSKKIDAERPPPPMKRP